MKKLSLDETFEWYTAQIRRMHDALNLHEWVQDFRPWNSKDQYHVQCRCGTDRCATKEEFDAAEHDFDGY